jgi:hypothetical protein
LSRISVPGRYANVPVNIIIDPAIEESTVDKSIMYGTKKITMTIKTGPNLGAAKKKFQCKLHRNHSMLGYFLSKVVGPAALCGLT